MTFRPEDPSGPAPGTQPALDPLNIMVLTMAGALVMIAVVLFVAGGELIVPEAWTLLVVAVATAGAWGLTVLLPTPRPRSGQSVRSLVQAVTITRLAVLEAPAILAVALAFLSSPVNLTIYLLAALFAISGIVLFARPAVVRRRIDQAGHRP